MKGSSADTLRKEKIAISIDKPMLEMVDAMVDGTTVRSRSQAIEFLIARGIEQQYIKDAVILIRGQEAHLLLKKIQGATVLSQHITWLMSHGIRTVYLITGTDAPISQIEDEIKSAPIHVELVLEQRSQGNIPALQLVKDRLRKNFVLMLGDTLNIFDLTKMILFHLKQDKIATVGLISTANPKDYSTVELEGDRIVEFRQAKSTSHIIDAGIYIFKPTIFTHMGNKRFFEKEVLPQLCHTNEIKGYFTHGNYTHLGEK